MKYYAAVSMLKIMVGLGLLDHNDYAALETTYAERFHASVRFRSPGQISVETGDMKGSIAHDR